MLHYIPGEQCLAATWGDHWYAARNAPSQVLWASVEAVMYAQTTHTHTHRNEDKCFRNINTITFRASRSLRRGSISLILGLVMCLSNNSSLSWMFLHVSNLSSLVTIALTVWYGVFCSVSPPEQVNTLYGKLIIITLHTAESTQLWVRQWNSCSFKYLSRAGSKQFSDPGFYVTAI